MHGSEDELRSGHGIYALRGREEADVKLQLIMGLAASMNAWQRQTCYFGHQHADQYSVLLLDNRGVGASDKPLARYTTSDMAADVIEVLDHVGWTGPRSVNVVGLSLGGMIAQELACAQPERIASLSLLCTTAALESDRPLLETLCDRVNLLRPKSVERIVHDTAVRLFAQTWLAAPDEAACVPSPRTTYRCGPAPPPQQQPTTTLRPNDSGVDLSPTSSAEEAAAVAEALEKRLHLNGADDSGDGEYGRFGSNYQRYQAEEMRKHLPPNVFSLQGMLCQIAAVIGHRKSASQLRSMADRVGRERILILHGAHDRMIGPSNGEKLIRMVRPGVGLIIDGMGHAPIMERTEWFNELLETRLAACAQLGLESRM